MEPGRPTTVQYYKYPDALHWRHDMVWLGEDSHGTWLGAPAGSTVQRGHEPPRSWPEPFVQLIPAEGWYTVLGNTPSSKYAVYVDIITSPTWVSRDRVEMIDVDLDVVRDWNGSVSLLDEDEFIEHQETLGYPPWLRDGARTAAAEVTLAVERSREPFGSLHLAWLARLNEL